MTEWPFQLGFIIIFFAFVPYTAAKEIKKDESRSLEIVKYLQSAMDVKADPCNDFYQFACGKWTNSHVMQLDKPLVEADLVDRQIFKAFSRALQLKSRDDEPLFSLLRIVYNSCINYSNLPRSERLFQILEAVVNTGIPISPLFQTETNAIRYATFDEIPDGRVVARLLGTMKAKFNADVFITLKVRGASLGHPTLYELLPDVTVTKNVAQNLRFIESVIESAYGKMVLQQKAGAIKKLGQFILQLQAIFDKKISDKKPLVVHMKKLPIVIPEFPWMHYFTALSGTDYEKIGDLTVITRHSLYFRRLGNLLHYAAKNHPDILSGFMLLRILQSFQLWTADFLQSSNVTSESCARAVNKLLPDVSVKLWLDRVSPYDRESGHLQATKMVSEIRSALKDVLMATPWLSHMSRVRALQKADSTLVSISYLYHPMGDKLLEDIYADLRLSNDDDFPDIVFQVLSGATSRNELNSWNKATGVSTSRWAKTPVFRLGTNALALPGYNVINVLVGATQPPFFHPDDPAALKFAGLGFIVGHEFGHIFHDLGGILPDAEGNPIPLLDQRSEFLYHIQAKCLVNQYSQYCVPFNNQSLCVNGEMSLHENIADDTGLKVAYRALHNHLRLYPDEKIVEMPGLENVTVDQLFFLAFARDQCGYIPLYDLRSRFTANIYAPHRYRVNGPLKNFPPFSAAFNCPLKTSDMNPQEKCTLW